MKSLIRVGVALSLFGISPASFAKARGPDLGSGAPRLSAGVREYFSSPARNSYGSDAAAKMKMKISSLGFDSMTLHTRIGRHGNALYLPPLRSSQDDLEIMTSRILHADAVPNLKPVILEDPGVGTPNATGLGLAEGEALFGDYGRMFEPLLPILQSRFIHELVIGSGVQGLFSVKYLDRWAGLLDLLDSRSLSRTGFALEISNNEALAALERSEREEPIAFLRAWAKVRRVRFTLPVAEWFDSRDLKVNSERLATLLQDRQSRIQQILPGRQLVLSNVFIPSCSGFQGLDSEVVCPSGAQPDPLRQKEALSQFLSVAGLNPALNEIELMMANTLDEPTAGEADPRFLIPNPAVEGVLRDWLRIETHRSESFLSPRKSAFRFFSEAPGKKHACIYFDEADAKDSIGAVHARMIDNLVGAFRDWAKERRTVSGYEAGELKECDVVFYLASNFNTPIPDAFLTDLQEFTLNHTAAWFNYKFDRFADRLTQHDAPLHFKVTRFLQADAPPTPEVPDPGFFRFFHYHGEVFEKPARFDPTSRLFAASPEIAEIELLDADRVDVLSHAEHSRTRKLTPYIVSESRGNQGRLFYIADLPFSFNHYEDRSLIFCDVIYDILREPAPDRPPLALVRLEDINPSISSSSLVSVVDFLADRKVPFSMALIPFYSNLFENPMRGTADPVFQPIDKYSDFAGAIRYAKARGANFVMHGSAHQAGDLISGFSGDTGSDYEFWSWPEDRPHPKDQASWVIRKIEAGERVLDRMRIKPVAWEVPHYAGSALDFILFGRMFEWNYHRGLYFKSEIQRPTSLGSKEWFFDCTLPECREARFTKAAELQVKADYTSLGSQIFPYPIFEDSYGQAVIPESIGMVDFAFYRPDTWREVSTPMDLLRRAKKLRVIRGAVASFFWHPILLDPTSVYYRTVPGSFEARGGLKTLDQLVTGLRDLGYEFASIGDCRWFPRAVCP